MHLNTTQSFKKFYSNAFLFFIFLQMLKFKFWTLGLKRNATSYIYFSKPFACTNDEALFLKQELYAYL